MASVVRDKGGRKRVLFVAEDGSRKTIRLGKASMKQAEAFKVRLESLIPSKFTGKMEDETARWVAALPDDIYAKLASVGLVTARVSTPPAPEPTPEPERCIGEFLDGYLKDRDDLKPNSLLVYGHTRRTLIEFFGADKPLRAITEYDAEQWQRYLMREGLSKATVRKRSANAKVFFRVAVKQKLILSNPFQELKSTSVGNEERQRFISQQDAQKVLDACPDAEWRLIFALARFGGLRTPSETLLLRWSDVDWERGRLHITSPKTEHHEGKESRDIPLFPELRQPLMEVFEQAEPGTEYVITRYRRTNSNLRTELKRIIGKAGLSAWPRLFQNLRSSRETELVESFPLHVVTAWIGNSKAIAEKHYLQVRDEDFERAASGPASAQTAAQCGANLGRMDPQTGIKPTHAIAGFPVETAACEMAQVLAGQEDGDEGNRTLIPAMRPPCAPVTPRPQNLQPVFYGPPAESQGFIKCFRQNHLKGIRIAIFRS
jgi:integrase